MQRLDLLVELLAMIAGISATTATVYAYSRHRTPLLREFSILNGALFSLALGFAASGPPGALWLAAGSIHETEVGRWASALGFISILARNLGMVTLTVVAPRLTASIFERQAPTWLRLESLAAAAALALIFVAFLALPRGDILMTVGMVLFFLNLATCLAYAVALGVNGAYR